MLLVFLFYAVFTPVTTILGGVAADNIKMNATALDFIIQAVTMLLNFVLEFLYTRFVVYRSTCDTAVSKNDTLETAETKESGDTETAETVDALSVEKSAKND